MQVYVAASCENRGRREVDCIIKKVLKTVESFVSRKERERDWLSGPNLVLLIWSVLDITYRESQLY